MIGIITCAGRGTRRRPDTRYKPKILLDYKGEPIFERIVRPIYETDLLDKLVFVVNPKNGKQVIDYTKRLPWHIHHGKKSGQKLPIQFVWQIEQLGFGHAVYQAADEVHRWFWENKPVLIHTDDSIVNGKVHEGEMDPTLMLKDFVNSDRSRIGVGWRGNVTSHGLVIFKQRCKKQRKKQVDFRLHQQIERIVEKPYGFDRGGFCACGVYYIRESRLLFKCLKQLVKSKRVLGGEYQLTHALQMMIDRGVRIDAYEMDWKDQGSNL